MTSKDRKLWADYCREKSQNRKESGLCVRCGNPLGTDGTTRNCRRCADDRSAYYRRRKERRICQSCGDPLPSGCRTIRCGKCQQVVLDLANEKRAKRQRECLCIYCGNPEILESTRDDANQFCYECYFKRISVCRLGATKHWKSLLKKFEAQGGCCAYTGEKLVLGENAALDHILPVVRFPDRANDPTNVEWVTRQVNSLKGDKTKDEFLATIRLLSNALVK